ncbi:precorrin-8X methylmutase [Spirochaetia bacterium]|nr:precorrin-8X methylmutase [Spirochaetia bacterium]
MNWIYETPEEIERRSFEIIRKELTPDRLLPDPALCAILLRVIHATADFSYAETFCASEGAVGRATEALRNGASIVTDTRMAMAGIDKKRLENFGGGVFCFISDDDVAQAAKENGTTRAFAAMDKAAGLGRPLIFAIGNAPTALGHVCDLSRQGILKPLLVIGAPVGFVNVVESKELLMAGDVPYITVKGRKGGSTVAAAICNALLRLAGDSSP